MFVSRRQQIDDPEIVRDLLHLLHELARRMPLVFAVPPRAAPPAARMGLASLIGRDQRELICLDPQPYLDNLSLLSGAAVVLTDSGGLQEESSVVNVACLTVRP